MRFLILAASSLLLAACASAPQPIEGPQQALPPPSQQMRGAILGLTSQELIQRFGSPALQVREGGSLKLQFRSPFCVLDAYLYPPAGAPAAPYRVTYVDAHSRGLAPVDQAMCLSSLQGA